MPLFRTDPIIKWKASRKKVWKNAETYYKQLFKETKKSLSHMVYLCSPLKATKEKLIKVHIAEAISAASQILGAKYNGKKIAVWIPHVHLFSIYNEGIYPESREKAIKFNKHLLRKYFHTLLVVGSRISGGMASEIEQARKNGTEVVGLKDFKKQLNNLPDSKKAKTSYRRMVKLHNQIHGKEFLIKH